MPEKVCKPRQSGCAAPGGTIAWGLEASAMGAQLTNQEAQLRGPQPARVRALEPARLKQQQRGGGPAGRVRAGWQRVMRRGSSAAAKPGGSGAQGCKAHAAAGRHNSAEEQQAIARKTPHALT